MPAQQTAAVVISARMGHPDTWLAVERALARHFAPVVLLTHRPPDDIDQPDTIEIVSFLPPLAKDGFLATNSVPTLSTLVVRAYFGARLQLPQELPNLTWRPSQTMLHRCLALVPPKYHSVSVDLETRLSELGLSCVQATDYRNFAHGRHTGFARTLAETTIVPIVAPPYESLANATLAILPRAVHIAPLKTTFDWPIGVLDLLIGSMKTVAAAAERAGVDAAKPGVPAFGRKLYHLSVHKYLPPAYQGPVDRKLEAAALPANAAERKAYDEALEQWLELMSATSFTGVVLDYDGTLNATRERFNPVSAEIRRAIFGCLKARIVLGIASGRGRSLYRALRGWAPKRWWSDIYLGLYNGGVLLSLADPKPQPGSMDPALADLAQRLHGSGIVDDSAEVEMGPMQLEVRTRSDSGVTSTTLGQWVRELMARRPALSLKVAASAHAIDITPPTSTKIAVADVVNKRCGGAVLLIGDQGQIGGALDRLLRVRHEIPSAERESLAHDRRGEALDYRLVRDTHHR